MSILSCLRSYAPLGLLEPLAHGGLLFNHLGVWSIQRNHSVHLLTQDLTLFRHSFEFGNPKGPA